MGGDVMYVVKSKLSILMGMANVNTQDVINGTGLARNTIKALKNNTFKDINLKTLLTICEYFTQDKNIKCEMTDLLDIKWI